MSSKTWQDAQCNDYSYFPNTPCLLTQGTSTNFQLSTDVVRVLLNDLDKDFMNCTILNPREIHFRLMCPLRLASIDFQCLTYYDTRLHNKNVFMNKSRKLLY